MSFKKRILCFIVGIALVILTFNVLFPASAQEPGENERILASLKSWIDGRYDSSEQAERDIANDVPDNLQHRLMYQVFVPVEVPFLDGVVVYQQASIDGSDDPEWVVRRGLLHFFVSPETGMVHQRELDFKTPEAVVNVHLDRSQLDGLTLDDFTWSEDCDFKLRMEPAGRAVSGPMDFGPCQRFNDGTGEYMTAEDEIRVTPDEFWFLGRYLDKDGKVMWGTESDEMNKLKRVSALDAPGILVFGGTRGTGLEVVKILAGRGDQVTAFVRPTSDVTQLEALDVTLVEGDALDADSVRSAFESGTFKAVISSLGGGRNSQVDDIGTINVAEGAKATGVDRFVMVSSIGAGESKAAIPFFVRWILGPALERKTTAENHLAYSGLSYTIVRPGGLGDGPATGTGVLSDDQQSFGWGRIPRAEVARLLVQAFDDPGSVNTAYHAFPGED